VSLGFKPLLSEEAEKEYPLDKDIIINETEGRKSTIKYVKAQRVSDSTQKRQSLENPIQEKKLFEDFFVIGIEKEDLRKFINENPGYFRMTY
jgi:hypothetical protein